MTSLLHRIVQTPDAFAFAIMRRQGPDGMPNALLEVRVGEVIDVDRLADIPLDSHDGPLGEVLALVPFRQVRERGFVAKDDGAPLRCLRVTEIEHISLSEALELLPADAVPLVNGGFTISDEDYADTVRRVIRDEIGRGEGANFVIRREFEASTEVPASRAVLAWLRALLVGETGAYWTYAVHTPGISLAGATPERHVGVRSDAATGERVVTMNPISGTYRHPAEGATAEGFRTFLGDVKETEELFMVVDEEMKMMSRVCSSGGRILGPYIKQMSRLTHTEYLLEGHSTLDVREVLRLTMFAPTVTGSPMQNACAVINRHERGARGYYSGVLALFTDAGDGSYELDAPILIRTAYINNTGHVRVPVGATLVRHSHPEAEVAETKAKAEGVLIALGAVSPSPVDRRVELAQLDGVAEALAARNSRLAAFWLTDQSSHTGETLLGKTATVLDAEDEFTAMLAHQLRHLGMIVDVVSWNDFDFEQLTADLLVAGPGPGDPTNLAEPRIQALSDAIGQRVASGLPLLAVCLSHQVLATQLGFNIERLPEPRQGLQLEVTLFGEDALIGFYNTFTARGSVLAHEVDVATYGPDADIIAIRGRAFASIQGHLESVLSRDGLAQLERLVIHALRG
ncbi:chorismate-binding protein [Lysinibacter cavernae]|uniref:anthranilate synthase n=1 Tax=Lysinibacter cavernae TaxID=1640652 RepID=A0A7X5TUI5_9MICO|nr:chorismate-binding protein [Lysinibacter cavernae]NIH53617.1 phenazine biosynthesis protein phzE [Lysinibacter cavernae]